MPTLNDRMPFLLGAGLLTFLGLVGLYRCSSGPRLYSGERLEGRPCWLCKETPSPRCGLCGGDQDVSVIVPSPSRPTIVFGDVFDLRIRAPGEVIWMPKPGTLPTSGLPGALEGVTVVIEGAGNRHELTTGPAGRFRIDLLPGAYTVRVAAAGYAPYDEKLEIPAITAPLWLEEGVLEEGSAYRAFEQGIAIGRDRKDVAVGLVRP